MNQINLIGRVCYENELKTMKSGKMVLNNVLAVDRPYSLEDETDFIPFVVWEKKAEFMANWIEKGGRVAISGRLQIRNFEDKEGNARTQAEVVVNEVTPIDWVKTDEEEEPAPVKTANQRSRNPRKTQSKMQGFQPNRDDLPF